MGVYIKCMEMPKSCAECDAEGHYEDSYGDEYGFFCPFGYKAYTSETRDAKRLDNCPLVEIPPHGRLIDADVKIRVQIYDDMTEDYHMVDMTIDDLLSQGWIEAKAPTIIEAEGRE